MVGLTITRSPRIVIGDVLTFQNSNWYFKTISCYRGHIFHQINHKELIISNKHVLRYIIEILENKLSHR